MQGTEKATRKRGFWNGKESLFLVEVYWRGFAAKRTAIFGWLEKLRVLQGKLASPHFYQLVCFWAAMGLRPLTILARNIGGPLGPRHVKI